jgi:hypothetical protein
LNNNSERDSQEGFYTIRYVTASDAASYRRILLDTTSRDRYYRFFHQVEYVKYLNCFDRAQLRRHVEPSTDVVSVIAKDGYDPLGIAHAFVQPNGSAEFAVIIAGHARRCGVAASLFGTIITALQARGITRLVAFSLAYNEPFARFATACGMESEPEDEDGVVTWALDLATHRSAVMRQRSASICSIAA